MNKDDARQKLVAALSKMWYEVLHIALLRIVKQFYSNGKIVLSLGFWSFLMSCAAKYAFEHCESRDDV